MLPFWVALSDTARCIASEPRRLMSRPSLVTSEENLARASYIAHLAPGDAFPHAEGYFPGQEQ